MEPMARETPSLARAVPDPLPRLELIQSTRGFVRLFEGASRARIVTYIAHASEVLDLFDSGGMEAVELVLGESVEEFRSSLDLARLDGLVRRLEDGSLSLLVGRKTIHSKLYLLDLRDGRLRVLHGSRNLYPSGSWDSIAVHELPDRHPMAAAFAGHYDEHRDGCDAYLGDLVGQVRREPSRRGELLEAWLKRAAPAEATVGPAPLLREAT